MHDNKKDPIVIYYGFHSTLRNQYEATLLNLSPKSLMQYILKQRSIINNTLHREPRSDISSPGYHVCPALHDLADNIYIVNSPFDIDIKFHDNNFIDRSYGNAGYCLSDRFGSFSDSMSADFVYELLMFSEEELEISITPPYMHNTLLSNYGFTSAAKLNIGKWFRPIPIIFHSWPGVKELKVKKDEPFIYINIENNENRKIIFKEFIETEELKKIVHNIATHKDLIQGFQPLKALYEIFSKSSMKNRILKEIKANLVS